VDYTCTSAKVKLKIWCHTNIACRKPAFIQPIKAIWKVFKKLWLTGKKLLLFWSC